MLKKLIKMLKPKKLHTILFKTKLIIKFSINCIKIFNGLTV